MIPFHARAWLLPALLAVAAVALVPRPAAAAERRWPTDILRETFGYTAETPSDVPWAELVQGCQKRDCIPSIDAPRFVRAAEARDLAPDDLVLGVVRGGAARAYPAWILDRHEIVNDRFGDEPVAVTWCPLCGSGLAFLSRLNGEPVALGVSGLLRESDLVFYDRKTNSLWQQVTGTAFTGPVRGQRLEPIPIAVTEWRRWREAHPETEVLASDSVRDPKPAYGDYTSSERILFPVSRTSRALHPKSVVWGIEVGGGSIAVPEERLAAGTLVTAEVGGQRLEISRRADGSVRAARADGVELVAHRMFWFAWYTFHPETRLLTGKEKP
ncbi:MAG: DUF3179 domain-containing protein [Thermoanaerobaculia bacterium]